MDKGKGVADFSLLGGPLYRLGCRLGLVRDGTNTIALGLVLGALPWIVLVALALAEHLGHVLFSIEAVAAHVRLLLVIPLFFVCEAMVDPQFGAFVREIVRSQVVPPTARARLDAEIQRIVRWRDSWLPEACVLLLAVLLDVAAPQGSFVSYLPGHSDSGSSSAISATTWSSQWYWMVCMTLFRFLLLRWILRLVQWSLFLRRLSKLELRLLPSHPDRAGGLGYLELVHAQFVPLIVAISSIQSASLAQEVASGRMAYEAIYPNIAFGLVAQAVLFLGPLFIFSPKLRKCRVKGILDFSVLGERYVHDFEKKWLGARRASAEELLGNNDIQSLADLNSSADAIRDMRIAPISLSLLIELAIAALLPLLPLALFKYPITELLAKFVELLAGV